jgi:hypothetical protein
MFQVGKALRQAVEAANSVSNNGTITANFALFPDVLNTYSTAVSNLLSAVWGVVNTYTQAPANKLQEGQSGSYLNLWGGPSQTTSYIPTAFSAGNIPDCGGGAPWVMPTGLVYWVSPLAMTADQLGLDPVQLCLESTFNYYAASLDNSRFWRQEKPPVL